jgi:hypothetical protein
VSQSPMPELSTKNPRKVMQGVVRKILTTGDLNEQAEIYIDGAEQLYQEIRIPAVLTDPNGNEVSLKEGTRVQITIEAQQE